MLWQQQCLMTLVEAAMSIRDRDQTQVHGCGAKYTLWQSIQALSGERIESARGIVWFAYMRSRAFEGRSDGEEEEVV